MDSLKLCMIGWAVMPRYRPAFRISRGAQVVANADLDQDRAVAVARRYGIANSYRLSQMVELKSRMVLC